MPGHWYTETLGELGHWNNGPWDTKTMGQWDTETMGQWDTKTGTPGDWDSGTMWHWNTGIMGGVQVVRVPTYRNHASAILDFAAMQR